MSIFVLLQMMKLWFVLMHIALVGTNIWATAHYHDEMPEDNEFAEFEDFEDDRPKKLASTIDQQPLNKLEKNQISEEDDIEIEDEADTEFDHFQDDEEFEGLDGPTKSPSKTDEPSTLTITKVPLHLRDRWDSYYLEILMITGLVVYFINYIIGRSKNINIAENWLNENRQILDDNFALVGDTGKGLEDTNDEGFIKESESQYSVYCSGRVGCESMLIELKLIKRQDLVAIISQIIRPQNDQAHLRIEISKVQLASSNCWLVLFKF